MYNTDGLELAAMSSAEGRYPLRLGRAIFFLALGAMMHLPAPGGPSVSTPLVSPLQFVRLEALRNAYEPPTIIVQQSIVYAATTGQRDVLEASNAGTDAIPVGTSGYGEDGTPVLLAEFRPVGSLDAPVTATLGLPPVDLSTVIEPPSSVPSLPGPAPAEKEVAKASGGPTARDEPMDPLVAPPVRVRAPDATIKPVPLAERRASEEELVRRLIDEYTGAYERLDVGAAKAVWPTVDGKALKRAFEQLTSQRLTLESCGITISGSTANARCRGSATYQPRIGSRSVQIASREWTFDLSKKDTDWRIVNTFVR